MEGGAVLGRLSWRVAEVVDSMFETPRTKTIHLRVPEWEGHRPGQHVDVRLTAEDGYQAERSYSIASAPADPNVQLTVERLEDGEVSPYLTDELRTGDLLELRGPIGGYFVWDGAESKPLLLVGGGSGIVPLQSMIRHRFASDGEVAVRLLFSSRSLDDVIYLDELAKLAEQDSAFEVFHTLTRSAPEGWRGYTRRVDSEMLGEVAWPADSNPIGFICGPTQFVENVATALSDLGYERDRIRTERFGPTGGAK